MARTANIEVFSSTINTGTTYVTSSEFWDKLGSADHIALEIAVDSTSAINVVVTVTYQHSNDPSTDSTWVDSFSLAGKTLTIVALSSPPITKIYTTGTDVLGAFGRVKVTTNADGTRVRLIACLRTN